MKNKTYKIHKIDLKEIYNCLFPKSFYQKYHHVGYSTTDVPKPWVPVVEKCVINIEKLMWPNRWLPMFVKRLIHYLGTDNGVVRLKYKFFYNLRTKLTKGSMIMQIKDKFAGLRIYIQGTDEMYALIEEAEKKCERICENCGHEGDDVELVGKGWIYNLCENCTQKKK